MESEQPTAVKASASIEDPQSNETPTETGKHNVPVADVSPDKVQTKPTEPTNAVVEMEQQVKHNESTPVNALISDQEKVSGSVESATKEQQVAAMECEVSQAVEDKGNPAGEQESPQEMDCQLSPVAETDSQKDPLVAPQNLAHTTANKTPLPQVQPAPEANPAPQTSGLGLLAAYGSDADDTDVEIVTPTQDSDNEVVEVPVTDTASSTAYRPVVAVSSGGESSESSSSSDSDSDSEGEYLTVLRKKIEKRINTVACDEDDEDLDEDGATGDPSRRRQPPKVRGEMLLEDLPPIHQLEITVPEDECVELGKVQSIVDQLVLVSVLPNSMLFDLDTVLFLEKGRKVLGEVFDVLGQVSDPIYCVRFNSNQQILDRGITIGDVVYCAPKTEHTQFVILSKLMQVRGSDASWEHDVEPPARHVDHSDDEEEREARSARRKRNQRDRANSTDSVDSLTSVATTATTATEASSVAPPRQRGRRGQRESFRQSQRFSNSHNSQDNQSQPRDQQYNYHPSYNPGSWHSNYYQNYHQAAGNFNMPPQQPGMPFPVPNFGYGMPYAMPPMYPHMYPPPPPFAAPPPNNQPHQGQPPPS
ncbi:H/ACA ribonucleoprotein complex non-core subunit NAF1 [Drosophila elegans]|uniref:H/ACA ribonucleoprotein complex non-core subunit NAF1 n=1 Tax=Drosophila elegans TaxID=30023 RepID=UPI0007E7E9F1|nr:H/ACA ribonucleoprotein complex non-core subunit NAF1 [Drosophila elegans]